MRKSGKDCGKCERLSGDMQNVHISAESTRREEDLWPGRSLRALLYCQRIVKFCTSMIQKLSAKKRELLYDEIMDKAVAAGVGMASPARIDEINILQATYEAMRQAVEQLGVVPDVFLNDAVTIPEVTSLQVPIIQGDAKSVSIAAASILAKVTRDRLMVQYDEILPGYGFARNKGYGSAEHIRALKELGPSPIHRQSFIKSFVS